MRIVRRLFVVPLADNDHGKTTMIRALVSQGGGIALRKQRKLARGLTSPGGRPIDAYVFGRSYQEVEKSQHKSILATLDTNDPDWRTRELIVMPSHVGDIKDKAQLTDDIDQIIEEAHGAGFDAICATVLLDEDDRSRLADIWRKAWDERWTIPNPHSDNPEGQLEAIGRDLWVWICRALTP